MKAPMIENETAMLNIDDERDLRPSEDFAEYLWMADELEEFDRQVEEELWEEFFIESCFEEMLIDEDEKNSIQFEGKTIAQEKLECLQAIQDLMSNDSKLNPNAPEFIPSYYCYADELQDEEDYVQR